jgi:drug/metabolite transporter (DMT)-like permease
MTDGTVNQGFDADTVSSGLPSQDVKAAEIEIKKSYNTGFLGSIKNFVFNEKGIFISILSALTVALGGIFYKRAKTLSGSDNSILRYVFQIITMFIILKWKKISIFGPRGQRLLLCARAFFGIFAVIATNFAIKYIDPSDNIALSHSNIIITAILARIFLKEKFNLSHLISLLLTIGGVILIAKPSFLFPKSVQYQETLNVTENENFTFNNQTKVCKIGENREIESGLSQLIGVSFALLGAIGSAAIHIIIKKLCKNKVYFAVNTIYGTYLGLPTAFTLSLVLILTGSSHKDINCELEYLALDLVFGCLGGILAVVGHVLLNISLQHEDATKVSIVRTVDVVFSFVFQFIILNIKPDWISIVGALMILLSTFVVLFYKIIKQKVQKKKEEKKKNLRF